MYSPWLDSTQTLLSLYLNKHDNNKQNTANGLSFTLFSSAVMYVDMRLLLTRFSVDLVLWNDDLTGIDICYGLNGVPQDTDDPYHLANFLHTVRYVTWVTDQLLTSCNLQTE